MYRQLLSIIVVGACSLALHAQTTGSAKKSLSKAKAAPKVIMKVTPQPIDTPHVHEPLKLVDFRDSLSYALGVNVIGTIQSQQLDINPKILIHALEDAFGGRQPCLTENDMMNVFKKFEQSRPSAQTNHNSVEPSPEDKKKMEEIVAKGKAYLVDNAKKEGVHTTASGLQYRVLTQGTGAKPLATDKVKVHYKGTLIDGKEFDSSYKRGTPIEFPLNGVIKGWTEGVQLMSVGSKYEFVIPAELAYGDRGAGSVIPPGSTLIFEVELLDIPSATNK